MLNQRAGERQVTSETKSAEHNHVPIAQVARAAQRLNTYFDYRARLRLKSMAARFSVRVCTSSFRLCITSSSSQITSRVTRWFSCCYYWKIMCIYYKIFKCLSICITFIFLDQTRTRQCCRWFKFRRYIFPTIAATEAPLVTYIYVQQPTSIAPLYISCFQPLTKTYISTTRKAFESLAIC